MVSSRIILLAGFCFRTVTARPNLVLLLGFVFLVASALGLTQLVKDTSVDAFIPDDHPSVMVRDRAQQIFGLRDPIIVAVAAEEGHSIYAPAPLQLLRDLHTAIEQAENIRSDRVMSLLSESAIYGADDALHVEEIGAGEVIDGPFAERVEALTALMPTYIGTLVAEDGSSAVIIAELEDQKIADRTYQDILGLTQRFEQPGMSIHVAGQGAVGGYLSKYIDSDSRKMQPVVVGVILVILFVAFLRLKALVGPLLVIAAAALGAVGLMAWFGIPYYAITSALPVVILSIAVADSIHVLTAYYELRARRPRLSRRVAVVHAMLDMWVPVTLTTLTTAAGFIGLSMASIMPPIKYFGLFAALGVIIAWAFTMFVLPACILKLKLERSPMFTEAKGKRAGRMGSALAHVALWSARRPVKSVTLVALFAVVAFAGASQLRVDRSQVDNFRPEEPIRVAHKFLNDRFAGTAYLDVIVETDGEEGLFDAHRMNKVVALQRYLESLPHISKTVSITDYLAKMHQALLPEDEDRGFLPSSGDGIAQYLFLYESSADPTDFQEEIDQGYQTLLVRAYLNSDYFSEDKPVVEAAEAYLAATFNEPGLTGTLTGRVTVDYHWMTSLSESHFSSVAISLLLVLLVSGFLFRSALEGLVALLPVMLTIVGIYALMALMGIYLEPATSMFAAISIGVGVDFSIHLIDRLKLGLSRGAVSVEDVVAQSFPYAARACFFNAASLGMGFCVLLISELPTLQRFGALVAFACFVSFFAALVIVPAAWALRERLRAPAGTPATSSSVSSEINQDA